MADGAKTIACSFALLTRSDVSLIYAPARSDSWDLFSQPCPSSSFSSSSLAWRDGRTDGRTDEAGASRSAPFPIIFLDVRSAAAQQAMAWSLVFLFYMLMNSQPADGRQEEGFSAGRRGGSVPHLTPMASAGTASLCPSRVDVVPRSLALSADQPSALIP